MAEWDTTALAEDVKERGSLPANDARFTTTKILAAATLEMREGVASMLSSSRVEYLVYPYTVAVTSGQASYRMPPRAVGGTLRNVSWVDSAGNPARLRELSQDEVEQIGGASSGGTPYGYYVRNYYVVLVPTPNVAGTLSMPYYARPNRLVGSGTTAPVLEVSNTGNTWTVVSDNTPTNVSAGTYSLDIVRATPGFETLFSGSVVVTEPNPDEWTYVFTAELGSDAISVGDYICLEGEAPVPQLPVELHGLLVARTARRLVKAVGDERFEAISQDVAELEEKAKAWIADRVAGQTQQAGGSIASSGIGPFGGAWWQW